MIHIKTSIKPYLLICILILNICANDFVEQFKWESSSWITIIIFIACAILISLVFISIYINRKRTEKLDSDELSSELLNETVKNLGITSAETRKIYELIRHNKKNQPHVLFQSISLFEHCVESEVERLLSKNINEEDLAAESDIISSLRRKAGYMFLPLEHPMVSTRNIAIGQSGSIFGKNHSSPIIQKAIVTDSNEFNFKLQYNVEEEEMVHISKGDELKFVFTRQNDGLYGIQLNVLNSDSAGNIKVNHTMNLKRNQMRQYVRIDLSIPIKLRLIRTSDPENSVINRFETITVKLSDISGGGLSFLYEKSLRPGDIVSLTFKLGKSTFPALACKVLRISLQEGKIKTYYKHHIQFIDIENRKRDKIVKFVFEKQRQLNQWN